MHKCLPPRTRRGFCIREKTSARRVFPLGRWFPRGGTRGTRSRRRSAPRHKAVLPYMKPQQALLSLPPHSVRAPDVRVKRPRAPRGARISLARANAGNDPAPRANFASPARAASCGAREPPALLSPPHPRKSRLCFANENPASTVSFQNRFSPLRSNFLFRLHFPNKCAILPSSRGRAAGASPRESALPLDPRAASGECALPTRRLFCRFPG